MSKIANMKLSQQLMGTLIVLFVLVLTEIKFHFQGLVPEKLNKTPHTNKATKIKHM